MFSCLRRSDRRKHDSMGYIIYFQIFVHKSVNIIFKNHYLNSSKNLKVILKIQWIFDNFAKPFCLKKF